MIRHACLSGGADPGQQERRRWLAVLPEVRVSGACECGRCPSIELWPPDDADGERQVLAAEASGLGLALFIDGGRPTYLEGFPLDDDTVAREFPPADEITYH
ncbi:hypothetical protein [Arsenicicoccus dermatophilus]|uniref:hypothetical protein n=1 Tax=Arsenicicoccus dermatophilus TaxID=1076331 RepID=UPI003916CF38